MLKHTEKCLNREAHGTTGVSLSWAMFGRAPPCLACCSYLPQIEPESEDVAKAREIVKETTETRLKNYLAQKILGCHSVKLDVGAMYQW